MPTFMSGTTNTKQASNQLKPQRKLKNSLVGKVDLEFSLIFQLLGEHVKELGFEERLQHRVVIVAHVNNKQIVLESTEKKNKS